MAVNSPQVSVAESRLRHRALASATLSIVTTFGLAYGISVYSPYFIRHLGAGATELAFLTAIVTSVYFLLGAVAAGIGERIGNRKLLLIAAATVAIGVSAAAAADSMVWVFGCFMVGIGLSVACGYVPTIALIGRWWNGHPRRAWALGAATSGVSIGTLIAAPLLVALVLRVGWRPSLVITGLLAAVLMVCAALLAPAHPEHVEVSSVSWRELRTGDRTFRVLYVSLTLFALPRFLPFCYLVAYAATHNVSDYQAGLLLTAIGVGGLVSRFGMGHLTGRLGALPVYRASAALLGGAYVIWLLAPPTFVWLAMFGLAMGATYGGIIATCPELILRTYGAARFSTVLSRLYTANAVGALGCLVGAGLLVDATGGYTIAIILGGAFAAAAAAVTLLIPRERRPGGHA